MPLALKQDKTARPLDIPILHLYAVMTEPLALPL
jgi:hypothetical protein